MKAGLHPIYALVLCTVVWGSITVWLLHVGILNLDNASMSFTTFLQSTEAAPPQVQLTELEQFDLVKRILNLTDTEIALKTQWLQYKSSYSTYLQTRQYCMLWCPSNDSVFQQDPVVLYPGLDAAQIEKLAPEDALQNYTASQNNIRCCQYATQSAFKVLVDTRETEMLDDDVTLVTMGTYSRISALLKIRDRWAGPIVFLMYGTDYNDQVLGTSAEQDEKNVQMAAEAEDWDNILILSYIARKSQDEIVLREGMNLMRGTTSIEQKDGSTVEVKTYRPDFPINALRNVIMDHAKTRFVFASDLDFVPDIFAYSFLTSDVVYKFLTSEDKVGLVFPHFEPREGYNIHCPKTFSELDSLLMDAKVRPFHCELTWWQKNYPSVFNYEKIENASSREHFVGIRNTNYAEWILASRQKEEDFLLLNLSADADIKHYEPFFVQSRVTADGLTPRYNEVFVTRYLNKVSYVSTLRRTGYRLYSAVSHYLIHEDHPIENWEDLSRSSMKLYGTMLKLFSSMLEGIAKLNLH